VRRYLHYGLSFIVFLSLGTAACQAAGVASSTPTVTQSPVTSLTPPATALATPLWKQVDLDGVTLEIAIPEGWAAQKAESGLLVAERPAPMGANSSSGIELHIFVRRMTHFTDGNPMPENPALHALQQAVGDRALIGAALATEPASFDWDGHPAAYYLLHDGGASLGVVIGCALTAAERLVVLHLSAPEAHSGQVRARLADLLAGFRINGERMAAESLAALPDPLVFPAG
jgi:hypothetical protein